jgi:putative endonuclease
LNRELHSHLAGKEAERRALRFLQGCGLKFLGSNYRAARGEIDLILQDGKTIVFVEVRSRSSNAWMEAVESIDSSKVERIILASQQYLQRHGLPDDAQYRFDVVTLTGRSRSPRIEWIKGAFEA